MESMSGDALTRSPLRDGAAKSGNIGLYIEGLLSLHAQCTAMAVLGSTPPSRV